MKHLSYKIILVIPIANKLLEKSLITSAHITCSLVELLLTRKKTRQLAKYPLLLRVKPLNKVYIIILSLSLARSYSVKSFRTTSYTYITLYGVYEAETNTTTVIAKNKSTNACIKLTVFQCLHNLGNTCWSISN